MLAAVVAAADAAVVAAVVVAVSAAVVAAPVVALDETVVVVVPESTDLAEAQPASVTIPAPAKSLNARRRFIVPRSYARPRSCSWMPSAW